MLHEIHAHIFFTIKVHKIISLVPLTGTFKNAIATTAMDEFV
jgi:hypothetical protein